MPGGSHRFDRGIGLNNLRISTKRREGEAYDRLQKFDPHEMGLQISYGVYPEKKRQKLIYGHLRKSLGKIFHELARRKSAEIVEGHLMTDHIHMCISIPPKYSVSHVVGYIKRRSAIAIARRFRGKQRNFNGEHFWA